MAQIVGIDGGGTRTRAVAVDQATRLVGTALGGGGNFQALGLEGLEALLESLWPVLGVQLPLEALCLGLAGAGQPAEQEAIARLAMARGWARQVRVVSDAPRCRRGGLPVALARSSPVSSLGGGADRLGGSRAATG